MFIRFIESLLRLSSSSDSAELDPELARLASPGFTGCLSAILFNSISPLKAALLHPETSPVTITGPLVRSDCGSASAHPRAAETRDHLSGERASFLTVSSLFLSLHTSAAKVYAEGCLVCITQWNPRFSARWVTLFCLCAAGQSGSVGAGQPVVDAIRRDSALIGGIVTETCVTAIVTNSEAETVCRGSRDAAMYTRLTSSSFEF